MCKRTSRFFAFLAVLCCRQVLTASPAFAGSISYETELGSICRVVTDQPVTFDMRLLPERRFEHEIDDFNHFGSDDFRNQSTRGISRFDTYGGSVGLTIPLGDTTRGAANECREYAIKDQQRQHFNWMLEHYENGVITRETLEKEAARLGLEIDLTGDVSDNSGGFSIDIPGDNSSKTPRQPAAAQPTTLEQNPEDRSSAARGNSAS